jgi:hypothetical protein
MCRPNRAVLARARAAIGNHYGFHYAQSRAAAPVRLGAKWRACTLSRERGVEFK